MKILDRYILVNFIRNYLIAFLVLIGLYIALDMVFNFDDLIEPPKSAANMNLTVFQAILDIIAYYAYQTPLIFVYLSGMIAVVGAAFTLMRLSRFNELTAIMAAGMSLRRVALPIILAGVGLNVILVLDQELLIPRIAYKLIRKHEDMHTETPKSFTVQMMQDDHNGLLCAARYTPPADGMPATIDFLDVNMRDENSLPCGHIKADRAVWDDSAKCWRLTNGIYTQVLRPNENRIAPDTPVATYKSDITPDEIALWRGGQYVALLPTRRIDQLLQRPKSYGVIDLLRAKNLRFTQPLSNVILLLLAAPSVLTREPGKLRLAAMKCLFLCGLCLGTIFLTYQLAATPPTATWILFWPALMAWIPIFIFGPLSALLLDRLKT
ncbi:MAG TPA: LptF/LptG family permease [Tepidisphaeraceae bacterium]|nr:LptF/LptG family permease [Tepidisphaeraceae bacterium]